MGPDTLSGGGSAGESRDKPIGNDARFEAMVAHAPIGLAILDTAGAFRYVNVAIFRLLGYTIDSLIGRQALLLVHPDDASRVTDAITASRHQPGRTIAVECRLCHLEGYWIDIELSAIDLTQDATINGLLLTLNDLTRYRAMSDLARTDEARARALFDTSMDAVLVCDDQRRFTEANNAAQTLLHRELATVRALRLDDLRPPEAKTTMERMWQSFLEHGVLESELDPLLPDGTARTVRLRLSANVTPSRHLLVLHDLTVQRLLER